MGQALSGSTCHSLGALGEFEWIPAAAPRSFSRASPSTPSLRGRKPADAGGSKVGDAHLSFHRRQRDKNGSWDFLKASLRSSRMCTCLDENDIESLVNALEYHVFDRDEAIMEEGTLGGHFFVSDSDGVEVWMNGGRVGSLSRGQTFGETALLLRHKRFVTVRASHDGLGVWAADGRLFRRALQAAVLQQLSENRTFLDSLQLFEGFTPRHMDDVADAAELQIVNVGDIPARAGLHSHHVYFVKSGKLRITAGNLQDGRTEDLWLGPRACICERVLMYEEPFSMTIEAVKRCELLRVDLKRLRACLGPVLSPVRLQQAFLGRVLQKSGMFNDWSSQSVTLACESMGLVEHAPDSKGSLPQNFFVVLDGSVKLGKGASAKWLRRGHWHGAAAPPVLSAQDKAGGTPAHSLVAGQDGCRLAVLATDFTCGGSSPSRRKEDPERNHARMVRTLAKVCVFRHLPRWQLDVLVSGVTKRRYRKGEKVFMQGDIGHHFFAIVEGECFVVIDGKVVRKIARFGYFGERALIFDEPRAATIEVASWYGAEIWAIDEATFRRVVRDKTLTSEQLKYRVWLQDPGLEIGDLQEMGEIGCGTSGVVHLVKHKLSGFTYALKRVNKKDGRIPRQVRREIEVLSENDHPFIMHLVKTLEKPDCVYMITEYISGGELHAAIRTITTVLTRSQAMFYTGCILLMLEALNDRDVVYRDLKPENLMLDSQGYLKLIDFGTAKKLDSSCLRTFTMIGTPHYMAPEMMRGKGYGTEVDVWAMGVILYELACGYLPFGDNSEVTGDVCKAVLAGDLQFPPDLEENTRELIQGLLVAKPHERLGCNTHGYEEIKEMPFFSLTGLVVAGADQEDEEGLKSTDFFSMLIGRELEAPIPPSNKEPDEPKENPFDESGTAGGCPPRAPTTE